MKKESNSSRNILIVIATAVIVYILVCLRDLKQMVIGSNDD